MTNLYALFFDLFPKKFDHVILRLHSLTHQNIILNIIILSEFSMNFHNCHRNLCHYFACKNVFKFRMFILALSNEFRVRALTHVILIRKIILRMHAKCVLNFVKKIVRIFKWVMLRTYLCVNENIPTKPTSDVCSRLAY